MNVKKTSLSDEDEVGSSFPITFIPHKSGTLVIDIYDQISTPYQFAEAITILNNIDEESDILINLQSPGGSANVADGFIHALRKTKAHIHIVATGCVASAATLILLEADSFELSENFHALIHCGSIGAGGNFNEFIAGAAFSKDWFEKFLRSGYEGFLTTKEMDDLVKGQDIWLDSSGWMERAVSRQEYFTKKIQKANKPVRRPKKPKVVSVE